MKIVKFSISQALTTDVLQIKELFCNTVLSVNRRHYNQAEVEDWASCGENLAKLESMIGTHYFIVARNDDNRIIGFSSITPEGYLHSMFVDRDFQNAGVATSLLSEVEQYAHDSGVAAISSDVSKTARPFFENKGYVVITEQQHKANQLYLTNYKMVKNLK